MTWGNSVVVYIQSSVFHLPLQESYPSTSPIWFVDSDDPSLAEVLERLEDVRKGSSLVSHMIATAWNHANHHFNHGQAQP